MIFVGAASAAPLLLRRLVSAALYSRALDGRSTLSKRRFDAFIPRPPSTISRRASYVCRLFIAVDDDDDDYGDYDAPPVGRDAFVSRLSRSLPLSLSPSLMH